MCLKRAYEENKDKLKYSYEVSESNSEVSKMKNKLATMNPQQRFSKKKAKNIGHLNIWKKMLLKKDQ